MPSEDDGVSPWRALGGRLADLRKAAGFTQRTLGPLVLMGRSSVANIETGHQQADRGFWLKCDQVLDSGGALTADYDQIMVQQQEQRRKAKRSASSSLLSEDSLRSADVGPGRFAAAEAIRLRVERSLGDTDVAPTSLDEWEETVAAHARAARQRPAASIFEELLADTDDVQQLLRRRHTASSLLRATRINAQMAGLLSLTLLKLNEFSAARRWGRTARIAAAECGDPATNAWVWAQEAHRYFYANDHPAAIAAAERAQDPAGGVGSVLAAALEGRARAAIGDATGTRSALGRAEDLLAGLGTAETAASALGYDEAQLRFHTGNAFTHLGDSASAWPAQDRALELYPRTEYMDRTLIHLDRVACLIHDGEIQIGSRQLVHDLCSLPAEHLDRLVVARAEAIIGQVPNSEIDSPAVRDAHDFLAMININDTESPQ